MRLLIYSFEADYPNIVSGDRVADTETNLCISGFVTQNLQRFRKEAMRGTAEKNKMKEVMVAAWDDLSISHTVRLFTSELLSIEFQLFHYHAMAFHPNTYTYTLNFRLHPSLQLELRDIFQTSTDYLELLSRYCIDDLYRQKLMRAAPNKQWTQMLKNREDDWIHTGAGPVEKNYERHVVLERGGIRVFFDPYQVECYAGGRFEVFVPSYDLKAVLNESIIDLLY
jgi:hypothetical protein